MGEMGEGLGFLMGATLGLLLIRMPAGFVRQATWIGSSLALGAYVSWANGELPLWPGFLAFDVPVVASSALLVGLCASWVRRQRAAG